MVNRPPHYTAGPCEAIEVIEHVTEHCPPESAYHIGQALKYLQRAPFKGRYEEDVRKARWYLNRAIAGWDNV